MESDQRPHRTKSSSSIASTATSELFICFTTSRLSSSSMKLSSKSLLSPGRARGADPNSQISLSSSLSRRLKTSGSMKGGQASPMFPNGGTNKKRGCAFENPEPSSPKVTCIGQVRVKTKKQGKRMRIITRSRRRGNEASFRRTESSNNNTATQSQELFNNNFQSLHFPNHQINGSSSNSNNQQECMRQRNQRWVHLPLTICEALRAFGSEFNCLFPNRSSCLATDKEKEESSSSSKEVRSESGGSSSCGAVFARWFVALQDGDGKGREIELVVGDDQERTERGSDSSGGRSQRRQVFEGIEFKEERFNGGGGAVEEEGGRVSICVPPKNALLLMRCRSDPVKMAALANRFWEMPAAEENEEDQEDDNDGSSNVKAEKVAGGEVVEKMGTGLEVEAAVETESAEREDGECEEWVREGEEHGDSEELVESLGFEEDEEWKEDLDEDSEKCLQISEEVRDIKEKVECQVEEEFFEQDEERKSDVTGQQAVSEDLCSTEVVVDPEILELEEQEEDEEKEEEVSEAKIPEPSIVSVQSEELEGEEEKTEAEFAEESTEEETETVMADRPESDPEPEPELENPNMHLGTGSKQVGQNSVLPDCLLLMMCEPKLSMEVSKETWVCSTDFIRCLPERHVKKIDVPNEAKKRVSIDSKPPLAPVVQQPVMMQPPRSSCSFPVQEGPVSMATMIGQKLVGSAGYEPFVLTRCKSEPMRSAAKLAAAPETCFWKNRKLEQHRQAAMGVGAAGVGF